MKKSEEFSTRGFTILENLVPPAEVSRLYDYTLNNLARGNLDDGQVPGSHSYYQDKEVINLQEQLRPSIESSIGMTLLPVFCYHRVYRTGAILRMHKDSTRAEISASINLGQKGEIWELNLVDYNENTHVIRLNPGDGLIYFGNKLYHWRGKLVHADLVSQVMFHFVDKKGKHTLAAKTEIMLKFRKYIRDWLKK